MVPEQVLDYFGSGYNMNRETGMSHVTLRNWLAWGYVPLKAQKKLAAISGGILVVGEPYTRPIATQEERREKEAIAKNLELLEASAERQLMLQRALLREIKKAKRLISEGI